MHGRARSAFYAFATITIVSMLALAGTSSTVIGLAQLGVVIEVVAASARFTIAARRARTLNYARATVYHAGLLVTGGGGAIRALGGDSRDYSAVLGFGVLLLLGIAMSNSWQLVISHDPPAEDQLT
jgi:hypothetical protein